MKIKSKNERIMIPSFVYSKDSSTMVWEETEKTANFIKSSICFCIVGFFSLLMQSMKESNV